MQKRKPIQKGGREERSGVKWRPGKGTRQRKTVRRTHCSVIGSFSRDRSVEINAGGPCEENFAAFPRLRPDVLYRKRGKCRVRSRLLGGERPSSPAFSDGTFPREIVIPKLFRNFNILLRRGRMARAGARRVAAAEEFDSGSDVTRN